PHCRFIRGVEQRRPEPRRRSLQSADDRVPLADEQEFVTVVVEGKHAGDLPPHALDVEIRRPAGRGAHFACWVLPQLDSDLVLIAVETERQPHNAVPVLSAALAEAESGGFRPRERPPRPGGGRRGGAPAPTRRGGAVPPP